MAYWLSFVVLYIFRGNIQHEDGDGGTIAITIMVWFRTYTLNVCI